jgi:alpha-tubulin suppressor-like RCC1 family protein
MSLQWPGGILSKTPPTITAPTDGEGGSASGMWTIAEAMVHKKAGNWPLPILDAELYAWGDGLQGQLGQGNTTDYSSPVQVGTLITWSKIALAKESSFGVTSDGKFYSWGDNNGPGQGQLGLGDKTNRSAPTQVGALTTWAYTGAGQYHTFGIKTDGTLWSWGNNNQGKLGLGDTTDRSSPVQVGELTDWSTVFGGINHSLAIKTDGTLWAWGQSNAGQLGQGNTTSRSSPVQVGSNTDWSEVSAAGNHSLAITTDGKLYSWGRNAKGQLGLGNTTYYSSPVQVGSLTTWLKVAGGGYGRSIAIKTDGTMWSWGAGYAGALGLGNTTNYSSPVQVGSLTTWLRVAGGYTFSCATKTDGTLWAWGSNAQGQLGQENTTSYSSPVQVGALTTWRVLPNMPAAEGHTLAITKS